MAYDWGLQYLMASGSKNPLYKMILNDFNNIYKNLGAVYFQHEKAREASNSYYHKLLVAVGQRDAVAAETIVGEAMKEASFSGQPCQIRWRRKMDSEIFSKEFDLIVIGGGITGAGIFREAVRSGLQALLVEQADFAWGTSSRSSKLVHGGLRYLKEGRLMLTHESVKERERLLKEAPGLVEPIDFMMPIFKDRGPGKWTMTAGLTIYDMMAKKWRHRFYRKKKFQAMEPMIDPNGLVGGFTFMDAQVDDARLVMRLINEAVEAGGIALNYTRAIKIKRDATGKVTGIVLKDRDSAKQMEVSAGAVINATGVWAEGLHPSPEKGTYIRPLRGSHLIFPWNRVPLKRPVSFIHPEDKRPLFAIPWEGAVLVGTTDIDHETTLSMEPHISKDEAEYILNAMKSVFPLLDVDLTDCISTIAGVRPVLSKGKLDASQESREHADLDR